MRQFVVPFIVLVLFLFFIDYGTYNALIRLFPIDWNSIYRIGFIVISVLSVLGILFGFTQWQGTPGTKKYVKNSLAGIAMSIIMGKLVILLISLFFGILSFAGRLFWNADMVQQYLAYGERIFLIITFILFLCLCFGVLIGRYWFQLKTINLGFDDLPERFNGYKIIHFSDFHAGTFDSYKLLQKGLNLIQNANADLILFSGDLVNSGQDEIKPFIDQLKKLNAPDGKFAVLGNHDYYGSPRTDNKDVVRSYWDDFYKKFEAIGFQVLNNTNILINKAGNQIRLIGVENWGTANWTPKRGDFARAIEGTSNEEFSILLSHDPSHWDEHIVPHPKKIHLTLSGHTHGMQVGIPWLGTVWNPMQHRIKRWIGLYQENKSYLYINRGFGHIGFPGRFGMWPEVTLITLSRSQ